LSIVIAILSDIHFKASSGHPILGRADQIASAISTSATEIDTILLVFAGDTANSGLREEFDLATGFLQQLKYRLASRVPHANLVVAAVPGNHDCFLPEAGEDHRRSQVEASIKTVTSDEPDDFFLKELLLVQDEFWNFANANTNFSATDVTSRICSKHYLKVGDKKIQLNLLNSAILSQRHENRADLYLPVRLYNRILSLDESIDFSLSILHHPPFWIEPSTMISLRGVLNRASDAVITGHAHLTAAFSQTHTTGEVLNFYESPALYDSSYPQSSAFRVLVYDPVQCRQRELGYRWKNSLYRNVLSESESDWKPLVINRSPRYAFDITHEHLAWLSDIGVAYVHPNAAKLRLSELFVYPDLRLDDNDIRKGSTTVKGANALEFLCTGGVIALRGGTFSGKTALSKSLCLDANLLMGKTALILDGREINNLDTDGFRKLIVKEFKRQYRDPDAEAYLQLPPEQKVVVIDNWHLARLTPENRSKIYKYLGQFSCSAVLFVDELFQLRQIITKTALIGVQGEEFYYRHGEIIGLSYVSRGELINRWYRLRKDSANDPPEESNAAKISEDRISGLLGKDNLPPYAFFVLCMLQAQEIKKLETIAGGSFGHYHEVLVITALSKNQSQLAQLDRKVAFCSEIAYFMWKYKIEVISRDQIDEIAAAYLQNHLMSLQVDDLLKDLEDARVLSQSEEHYRFSYNQFYFYFVARYIKEHFDGNEGPNLRAAVDEMIDNISSHQNSTIIMFLIFFANERRHIIEKLLANASQIFEDVTPARLDENDAKPFLKRKDHLPPPSVDETADIADNRLSERIRKDELAESQSRQLVGADEAYQYSPDLPDPKKMHLAERNIDALGQVIRNFSATLPGDLKVSVLQATYTLGLRTMARVLHEVAVYLETKTEEMTADKYSWQLAQDGMSIRFLREEMDKFLLVMGKLVSIHYCKKISSCVGVSDNELAYEKAMEKLTPSVAIKLVDITIQMEHSRTFPEAKVTALFSELRSNPFAIRDFAIPCRAPPARLQDR